MTQVPAKRPFLRALAAGGLWALCLALVLAALAFWERGRLSDAHRAQSARLHTLLTQRVGQHDAHMTGLSAVAVAAGGQRDDLFLEVARGIMRFYTQIDAVLLVGLAEADGRLIVGDADAALADVVRRAAARAEGRAPRVMRDPHRAGRHLYIKRSPNSAAARYALAMVIAAEALMPEGESYWQGAGRARQLALPDGTVLFGAAGGGGWSYEKPLSSASQPFVLRTGARMTAAELLPPLRVGFALLSVTLAFLALALLRRARRRERAAEQRAELRGREAELSHATRVNALGEMASGIAHELTQPLTAVLAQAQAARRLAARGEAAKAEAALGGAIEQTKRAAALLERLRSWTNPRGSSAARTDLRQSLRHVQTLVDHRAGQIGAALVLTVPEQPLEVMIDPVEAEQIIFNLVSNALDALERQGGARQIRLALSAMDGRVRLDVRDSGEGIAPALRPRLFEPFVTSRDEGTGLGLALSQRLAERAAGTLELIEESGAAGAHFRLELPLATRAEEGKP